MNDNVLHHRKKMEGQYHVPQSFAHINHHTLQKLYVFKTCVAGGLTLLGRGIRGEKESLYSFIKLYVDASSGLNCLG